MRKPACKSVNEKCVKNRFLEVLGTNWPKQYILCGQSSFEQYIGCRE